jgi:predicted nucleotidyltransferase
MLPLLAAKKADIATLCRKHHVRRLEVFGSAARGDFDPAGSDIDFLVEFDRSDPEAMTLHSFLGLKDSLEALLGRPVDLVDRQAVETSRNFIRRRSILSGVEPIYG